VDQINEISQGGLPITFRDTAHSNLFRRPNGKKPSRDHLFLACASKRWWKPFRCNCIPLSRDVSLDLWTSYLQRMGQERGYSMGKWYW